MNLYIFIWFILGIVFIISELFIPGFTIFFFGMGALITAVTALFVPAVADSYFLQLLVWLITSVLSLVFLRKRFANTFTGKLHKNQTDSFIGKSAVVIDDIVDGKAGRISIRGTTWKAESLNNVKIYKNEKVIIKERKVSESLTFIVKKETE